MVNQINFMTSLGNLRLQHEAGLSPEGAQQNSFSELLTRRLNGENQVHFSRHAAQRVAQRGQEISPEMLDSLNRAVETARQKGSRDTLIIQGQNAFIVNIPNNTVVTMVSYQDMKENVFTNIDSAVVI